MNRAMNRARAGLSFLAAAIAGTGIPLRAQVPDTAAAVTGVTDFTAACRRDHGVLWGRTLCGPIVVADPDTRFAVASQLPPGGAFVPHGGVFLGRVPDSLPLSNTSLDWAGRRWATVRLPLPADRFARTALLVHESFHRIQPALGLDGTDALNAHLDERNGRYWLRLELRALAAALRSGGPAARRAATDAALFRAYRWSLYPGADTLENQLERKEGLAEYTGDKLALAVTGAPLSRVADDVARFEERPTYVRSLGYGTGPALGLLLDRYAPGWRPRVGRHSMARQLAAALRFVPPDDPAAAAAARAQAYDGERLAREEDVRESERQQRLAELRARLVTGPVLVLRQSQLMRAFNPNNLIPLSPEGTVYPTGSFSAEWGSMDVTGGGALVAGDFRTVRVPVPADTAGRPLRGEGWTLELAPGWRLAPGSRSGDLTVSR